MTATPVGQRIRDVRLQHGIGLRELARGVGVSPQSLLDWEQGNRRCNFARVKQVEKALCQIVIDRQPMAAPTCQRPNCGGQMHTRYGDTICRSCGTRPGAPGTATGVHLGGCYGTDV